MKGLDSNLEVIVKSFVGKSLDLSLFDTKYLFLLRQVENTEGYILYGNSEITFILYGHEDRLDVCLKLIEKLGDEMKYIFRSPSDRVVSPGWREYHSFLASCGCEIT